MSCARAGDCYPTTPGGKVVAVCAMLLGVLILALPISVVGSNFANLSEQRQLEALQREKAELQEGAQQQKREQREEREKTQEERELVQKQLEQLQRLETLARRSQADNDAVRATFE